MIEENKEENKPEEAMAGAEPELSPSAEELQGDVVESSAVLEGAVEAEQGEASSTEEEEVVSAQGLSEAYSHVISEPQEPEAACEAASEEELAVEEEAEIAESEPAEEQVESEETEAVDEVAESSDESEVVEDKEVVNDAEAVAEVSAASESGEDADDDDDDEEEEPETEGEISTCSVVEAILFAADEPVGVRKIVEIINAGGVKEVKKHIRTLNKKYRKMDCAFRIEELAGGYQMLTLSAYNPWLSKLIKVRSESKLTAAAMETLAIIAYKQPIMRVEIENVRGVAAGEMIRQLIEKGLVKITGRAEELGRPLLYGTTQKFLDIFGLATIKDLPQPEDAKKGK